MYGTSVSVPLERSLDEGERRSHYAWSEHLDLPVRDLEATGGGIGNDSGMFSSLVATRVASVGERKAAAAHTALLQVRRVAVYQPVPGEGTDLRTTISRSVTDYPSTLAPPRR